VLLVTTTVYNRFMPLTIMCRTIWVSRYQKSTSPSQIITPALHHSVFLQKNPKVIWEEPCCHSSWQRIIMPQSLHWLQLHAPNSPPKFPPPLERSPAPSNTPIPQTTHSPPKMVSRCNQSFCHSTSSGQTDRQTNRSTDGIGTKYVSTPTYALLIV